MVNPQNQELYAQMLRVTTDVISLMVRIPWSECATTVTKVEAEPGRLRITLARATAWGKLLSDHSGAIKQTQSYVELAVWLASSETVVTTARRTVHRSDGLPLTQEQVLDYLHEHVISRFLTSYLPDFGPPVFDKDRFDAIYVPFEEWLLTNTYAVITKAILHAFSSSDDVVHISEGARIRRATNDDFSEIANMVGRDDQGIIYGASLVEVESKVKSPTTLGIGGGYRVIEHLLTALRLLKAGGVFCGLIYSKGKVDVGHRASTQLARPQSVYTKYELSTSEAVELRRLFAIASRPDMSPELSAVMRRFNYAYERWRTDDRITDTIIALESLYVPDGESGEIAYKFRTRLAAMLTGHLDPAARRRLRDLAKVAYEIRSLLVHGAKDEKKVMRKLAAVNLSSIDQLQLELEDIARRSILKFIERPDLLNGPSLDDLVLGLSSASN